MPVIGTRREFSSCGRLQLTPPFRDETKRTSSDEPRNT
jgi:hypothetical protein